MASLNSLPAPANDLRSEAKEYQRDRNHNAKWARGFAPAAGKRCLHTLSLESDPCAECAVRPQHRDCRRRGGRFFQAKQNKVSAQTATMARKVFHNEVVAATDGPVGGFSDSSEEDDSKDASAAPVADAEVMYSYDAAGGPGRGSDLLSHAVTQAVHRYETKVTDKLAKEYEFVDVKDDDNDHPADEDDFEVVEHFHVD